MRTPRLAAALTALVLLGACSDDGPTVSKDDPTPSATPSATATATPATTPTATRAPQSALSRGVLSGWSACGGSGFECATLTVRLDDAAPGKGTIPLALTRHRATGSSRIGSLVINPGGPGASAVEYLQSSYTGYPKTVRQHFDLVAFDPRGVGRTQAVHCQDFAQLDEFYGLDPVPDDQRELQVTINGNKEFAQDCQRRSGRVLPYVSTDVVAQDLERLRIALGDPKLTYLGYSYGTSIGAAYLDQFPRNVRAMVLDGALDPSSSWDQLLAGQSRGFDTALQAFFADCEAKRCAFRQEVSGDLGKAYDALAARVEKTPISGDGDRKVGPAELSYGTGRALYSKSFWPYLGDALAQAQRGDGKSILLLNDDYLERTSKGYSTTIESNYAVNCVDRPWPRTVEPYQQLADRVAKQYPRFGPFIALSGLACAYWPVPPSDKPHRVTAPGSPAVVVLGNTRDPATPFFWAQALAAQLSRGVLLTHDGDGHTVYRNSAPSCIKDPVNAYLVSLTVPREATC